MTAPTPAGRLPEHMEAQRKHEQDVADFRFLTKADTWEGDRSPPWVDENGREWDTADGHPILMGHDQEPDPGHPARLTGVEAVKRFLLAGNATVTLVSGKTGDRYTYRVRDHGEDFWFVDIMKGSSNERDFGYIGQIIGEPRWVYTRGRKCWETFFKQSDIFKWFSRHLFECGAIPPDLEVWHEGRCGRCSRKLTVPESIASGFGPECITHV